MLVSEADVLRRLDAGTYTLDRSPELEAELRERLLQAGEARAGGVTTGRRSRPTFECNRLCIV